MPIVSELKIQSIQFIHIKYASHGGKSSRIAFESRKATRERPIVNEHILFCENWLRLRTLNSGLSGGRFHWMLVFQIRENNIFSGQFGFINEFLTLYFFRKKTGRTNYVQKPPFKWSPVWRAEKENSPKANMNREYFYKCFEALRWKQANKGLGKKKNGLHAMIHAGSKGTEIHWAQITTSVGQQFVLGERMEPRLRMNKQPSARGYVRSSFASGLKPHKSFSHQSSAREGVIDTSTCTASAGFFQRRMTKSLDALCIAADILVARSNGLHIVSLAYGGDGLRPPRFSERHSACFSHLHVSADIRTDQLRSISLFASTEKAAEAIARLSSNHPHPPSEQMVEETWLSAQYAPGCTVGYAATKKSFAMNQIESLLNSLGKLHGGKSAAIRSEVESRYPTH